MISRFATLAAIIISASCGGEETDTGDSPSSAIQVVDSKGGRISVRGLTMEIPKGAVDASVEIEIRAVEAPSAPAGIPQPLQGAYYEFLPHGLQFNEGSLPSVTIKYNADLVQEGDGVVVGQILEDGSFAMDTIIETSDGSITAEVAGFSSHGAHTVANNGCRIVAIIDAVEATSSELINLHPGVFVLLRPSPECGDPSTHDFNWLVGSGTAVPTQAAEIDVEVDQETDVVLLVTQNGNLVRQVELRLDVRSGTNTQNIYSFIGVDPSGFQFSTSQRLVFEMRVVLPGEMYPSRLMDAHPGVVDHVLWTVMAIDSTTAMPTHAVVDHQHDSDDIIEFAAGALNVGHYRISGEAYDSSGALVTETHEYDFEITQ